MYKVYCGYMVDGVVDAQWADGVAVIADIVGSRALGERREAAQHAFLEAFGVADDVSPPQRSAWATSSDEFQAVYATVDDAVDATLVVRLALPHELDLRFGIGVGELREVGDGGIMDGSAWWRAREAIDEAHRREDRGSPYLRTWFAGEPGERVEWVNAQLLLRDHIVSRMKERERRVALASLLGVSQREIADREHISQPAVSQNLLRSGGAALIAGRLLRTEAGGS